MTIQGGTHSATHVCKSHACVLQAAKMALLIDWASGNGPNDQFEVYWWPS